MLVEIQLIQAVIQAGALGIIVYLVIWLTRTKIPDDRREREAERVAVARERQEQVVQREAVQASYAAQAKLQRDDYLASLREVRAECAAEADECRKERLEQAKQARMEREADRLARHELGNMIQKVIGELHDALPNRPRAGDDGGRPR